MHTSSTKHKREQKCDKVHLKYDSPRAQRANSINCMSRAPHAPRNTAGSTRRRHRTWFKRELNTTQKFSWSINLRLNRIVQGGQTAQRQLRSLLRQRSSLSWQSLSLLSSWRWEQWNPFWAASTSARPGEAKRKLNKPATKSGIDNHKTMERRRRIEIKKIKKKIRGQCPREDKKSETNFIISEEDCIQ